MIPKNISREHIKLAMAEIDRSGVPKGRNAKKFHLIYNGKTYPPKYTVGLANKFANENMLKPGTYHGGAETNGFLEERGFEVVNMKKVQLRSDKEPRQGKLLTPKIKLDKTTVDLLSFDEIYLRIWEKQQDIAISRWSIITFFMSVSFALFGFSFAQEGFTIDGSIQRVAGLVVYWLSYILYRRYSDWTHFLRAYLLDMEEEHTTTIDIQSRSNSQMGGIRKLTSINQLLLYFGLFYLLAVVVFWNY